MGVDVSDLPDPGIDTSDLPNPSVTGLPPAENMGSGTPFGLAEAGETALALGSGVVSSMAGSAARIYSRVKSELQGKSLEEENKAAAQATESVNKSDLFSAYQPRTKGAQEAVGAVGGFLNWLGEPFKYWGKKAENLLPKAAQPYAEALTSEAGDVANVVPAAAAATGAVDVAKGTAGAVKSAMTVPKVSTEAAESAAAVEGGAKPAAPPLAAAEPAPETHGITAEELLGAPEEPPAAPKPAPKPKIEHTEDADSGQHVVTSENGHTVAQEDPLSGHIRVQSSHTAAGAQGEGEGSARLAKLSDVAESKGLTLGSDRTITPAGVAAWERFGEDQGRTIRINPHTVNGDTGSLLSTDPRRPVLEVEPHPPEDLKAESGRPFSTLSAERSNLTPEENKLRTGALANDLQAAGLNSYSTVGGYTDQAGNTSHERSFLVHGTDDAARAKVEELAKKYDQESVLHVDADRNASLRFSAGGDQPVGKWGPVSEGEARSAGNWTRDANGQHYATVPPEEPLKAAPVTPAEVSPSQRGGPKPPPTNLTFRHFSNIDADHVVLNPNKYGIGLKGEEATRVANGAPKTISLYGAEHPNEQVEPGLRGLPEYRVTVPRKAMYDLSADPRGFIKAVTKGGKLYDHTRVEQLIKSAGYAGYHLPEGDGIFKGQGRLFKPAEAARVGKGAPEVKGSDVRPISWDQASANTKGQTAEEIKREAAEEKNPPKGMSNREALLRHLGLNEAADRLAKKDFFAQQRAFPRQRGGPLIPKPGTKAADVFQHLTPEEQKQFRSNFAKRVVDIFTKKTPPVEEFSAAALAGKAKKGWYDDSARAISHVYGPDAPRFSALLAATSPQNSLETNFLNSARIFNKWDEMGRPTDRAAILKIMGETVQGENGEKSVLDAWRNNTVRALTHPDPEKLTLSGPKVDSFMKNLHGNVHEVTNDSWMAAFGDMLPAKFGGSANKLGPGKSATYIGFSAKVRAAAKQISAMTGEKWTPREVQETIWSWIKTASEHADSYKGLGSVPDLVKSGEINDELIRSTPDFATLFSHPDAKRAIGGTERAGRAAELAGAPRKGNPAQTSSEAVAAAERDLAPHLENAAERIEAGRLAREAGAARQPKTGPMIGGRRAQRGSLDLSAFWPFGKREGLAEAGGERSPESQAKVAATLKSIGLDKVRESAITGDKRAASSDFHTSELDSKAGQEMARVMDKERQGVHNFSQGLVQKSGGTLGTDRDALYSRGQTQVAPIDAYHEFLEKRMQARYTAGTEKANKTPIQLSGLQQFLKQQQSQFLGTTDGKQLLEGINARMKELGLTGKSEVFNPATVEQAERLRQYFKDQWTPRTGRLIQAATNQLDDDVMRASGEDVYAAARADRAKRAAYLEEPEGVSALLHDKNKNRLGINRNVDFEKVPTYIEKLPIDQFSHVVRTIREAARGNPEIAPLSAASLNEIRAQFANKLLDAGNSTKGMWNAKAVDTYLKDNMPKMKLVFKPEEIAQYQNLADAGHYLDIDRRYPGAAVQAHNLMTRGALGLVKQGAEAIGAHLGGIAGYAAGHVAAKGAEAISNRSEGKMISNRIRELK